MIRKNFIKKTIKSQSFAFYLFFAVFSIIYVTVLFILIILNQSNKNPQTPENTTLTPVPTSNPNLLIELTPQQVTQNRIINIETKQSTELPKLDCVSGLGDWSQNKLITYSDVNISGGGCPFSPTKVCIWNNQGKLLHQLDVNMDWFAGSICYVNSQFGILPNENTFYSTIYHFSESNLYCALALQDLNNKSNRKIFDLMPIDNHCPRIEFDEKQLSVNSKTLRFRDLEYKFDDENYDPSSGNLPYIPGPWIEVSPSKPPSENISINKIPLFFGNYKIVLPDGYGWTDIVDGILVGQSPGPECEYLENGIPNCRYVQIMDDQKISNLYIANHREVGLDDGIVMIMSEKIKLGTGDNETDYDFYWQSDDNNLDQISKDEKGNPSYLYFVEGCPKEDLCFVCDVGCDSLGPGKIKKFINETIISENL